MENPLKLNLGCGKTVVQGFEGVDILNFGQKHILDLTKGWPWLDDSVDEVHCSHFIEHLDMQERTFFVNSLYRVMKPGAKATIIFPHFASGRAYGDPTHKWPPLGEMWFYYLSKNWRNEQAPHVNGLYLCDFEIVWGYVFNPEIEPRNQEFKQFASYFYKEAIHDVVSTWTKKVEDQKK